jgi:ribulose-bisphosphate carboxylase large chain
MAPTLNLSGERFFVKYLVTGSKDETEARAIDICFEQTVEFPEKLVPDGPIREQIVGRLESLEMLDEGHSMATVSYAVETAGAGASFDLTQLFNVIFGNLSIKPGYRVEDIMFSPRLYEVFKGPRFGRAGLRESLKIAKRPLLSTALKPMGLSAKELGDLAYQLALGGIDILKDDHGLADQPFAPFTERVKYCSEAVRQANVKTGLHCIYVPNVTAANEAMLEKAYFAKKAGVGGLLVSPGLVGFDMIRRLADDERINLPIISHPAFLGSYVMNPESGISHYALFGQMMRIAGADAVVYPNYGGRFSFSKEDCIRIVAGTSVTMGPFKTIFPAPGGGMSLDRVQEMLDLYGRDIIFLIGGGLHSLSPDLFANCKYFRKLVEEI